MKNLALSIAFGLSFILCISAQAAESWKVNLDAGDKILHYQEIQKRTETASKTNLRSSMDNALYSTVKRDDIRKSGKYFRAVLAQLKKNPNKLPNKPELDTLTGSLAMVWHDEIKYSQESTQNLGKEAQKASIRKVLLRMQQDHTALIDVSKKVLGENDADYQKMKKAGDKLDAALAKH